jgi:hypothetical protein
MIISRFGRLLRYYAVLEGFEDHTKLEYLQIKRGLAVIIQGKAEWGRAEVLNQGRFTDSFPSRQAGGQKRPLGRNL